MRWTTDQDPHPHINFPCWNHLKPPIGSWSRRHVMFTDLSVVNYPWQVTPSRFFSDISCIPLWLRRLKGGNLSLVASEDSRAKSESPLSLYPSRRRCFQHRGGYYPDAEICWMLYIILHHQGGDVWSISFIDLTWLTLYHESYSYRQHIFQCRGGYYPNTEKRAVYPIPCLPSCSYRQHIFPHEAKADVANPLQQCVHFFCRVVKSMINHSISQFTIWGDVDVLYGALEIWIFNQVNFTPNFQRENLHPSPSSPHVHSSKHGGYNTSIRGHFNRN